MFRKDKEVKHAMTYAEYWKMQARLEGREEGREEGIEIGNAEKEKALMETASRLIDMGIAVQDVISATRLSPKQVAALAAKPTAPLLVEPL